MIQDILPCQFYNQYEEKMPMSNSRLLYFREKQVMIQRTGTEELLLPEYGMLSECDREKCEFQYLFSIDQTGYFLVWTKKETVDFSLQKEYPLTPVRSLRQRISKEICFAVMTAWHLYIWYRDNRYCGRCGTPTVHDKKERMVRCPSCGNMIFPKIAPAVIIAVTDGDRILMSKYADRDYKKYALLAGFTEIGETAEETVAREVMEEVGLKVKNICYYKSQPWGIDSNLLLGYFCELDGDDTIVMDTTELAVAQWFHREEMPVQDDGISLTREMMRVFQQGNLKKI